MLALVAALGMYFHPATRLLIDWRYGQWRLCGAETGDRMPRPSDDGARDPLTDHYWFLQYMDLDALLAVELAMYSARRNADLAEDEAMSLAVEETRACRAEKAR